MRHPNVTNKYVAIHPALMNSALTPSGRMGLVLPGVRRNSEIQMLWPPLIFYSLLSSDANFCASIQIIFCLSLCFPKCEDSGSCLSLVFLGSYDN